MRVDHDPYELLGVPRDASAADVRWAYERALNRASRDGAHRFMTELSQAYDTLSDPTRRRAYDRHGLTPLRERSPGAAPLPPPWRIVKQQALPHAPELPHRRRSWRTPTVAIFLLGIVAGLVLAVELAETGSEEPPTSWVVCAATPAGPGYTVTAPSDQPPMCMNGAVPQVTG